MIKYNFTSDLRISSLKEAISSAAKNIANDTVGLLDKSGQNNTATLSFYFNLKSKTNTLDLALRGDVTQVIRNFVIKFQYPNPYTMDLLKAQIEDHTIIAPLRAICRLLIFWSFLEPTENTFLTYDEIRYYIFCNPDMWINSDVDFVKSIIGKIKSGRVSEVDYTSNIKQLLDWKQYERQSRELIMTITYASNCFTISKGCLYFSMPNILDRSFSDEMKFISNLISFNNYWSCGVEEIQKANESYIEYMDIKGTIQLSAKQIVRALSSDDFPLQQIYFGAPGTGKSHDINEVCAEYENYRTTFHPDTDYASFVGSYKPITQEVEMRDLAGHKVSEGEKIVTTQKIVYKYVFQSFLKAYIAAWKEQEKEEPKPVFLIIEEINRGNCAQIFGDIFQLLDRNAAGFSDYPIVADDDLAKELKKVLGKLNISKRDEINGLYKGSKDIVGSVLNGENLLLPNNMYIWATMNTSDQSLFPIDSAFKRRWDWKYVKIKNANKDYRIVFSNGNEYDWWQFVSEINSRIEGGEIQQEDKKLGYFFAKAKDQDGKNIITAESFLSKVIFYLYNDVFKDFGFEEDFFKDGKGETMTFASFFDDYGNVDENRVELFIANLGLEPYVIDGSVEDPKTSNAKIVVGNVATSLRQTLYQITKQAIENNPALTFDEIKDAASVIQRAQDLFLLSDNVEAWKSKHANVKSSDQRYLFGMPLQAAGTSFVVLSQWGYLDNLKEPFEEYAKKLGVEIKFSE